MKPCESWARLLGLACIAANLLGAASCGRGILVSGGTVDVPTVDGLPMLTNKLSLPVQGTRQAINEVWVNYQDGSHARLSVAGTSTQWSGSINLESGPNVLYFYGKRPLGQSDQSPPYTVMCDITPPATPSVVAPDAVDVGRAASVVATISGVKDADSDIEVNGVVVVTRDGTTTWTAQITVVKGDNTYAVTSVDAAGNVSIAAQVSIFGSTLQTPIILNPNVNPTHRSDFNPNDVPYLTNQNYQNFFGTKQADTELFFLFNGAAAQDVGAFNSPSWDQNFTLPADGVYTVGFYVTQVGEPRHSGTAQVKIILKTTRPEQPILTAPTFPVADTGDASITLSGTLPSADSYLCVSATAGGACITTSSQLGQPFTVAVPLVDGADGSGLGHPDGTNPLYVSARDAYGNISDEIVQSVYRIAPPMISAVSPSNNAVVTGSTLPVSLMATPYNSDANHPASAIAAVHVCLDMDCVDAIATGGAGNYQVSPAFDMSGFLAGSTHTLMVTVSNSLGTPLQTVVTEQLLFSDGSPIWVSKNDPNQVAQSPRMVFDAAGNLHVVWSDNCAQSGNLCLVAGTNSTQPPDIFYAKRSAVDGRWSEMTLVSSTSGDGYSLTPTIALASDGNLHIAWSDDGTAGGKQSGLGILHRTLSPAGVLGSIVGVGSSVSGIDDVDPSLAADTSGNVHVAFTRKTSGARYDIFYARYVAGAWSSALQITTNSNTSLAERPALASAAQGRAHVAWQECRVGFCASPSLDHDIYLSEIAGPAALGFGPILVSDADKSLYDGDSLQPALVVDANNTDWVFWADTATLGSHRDPNTAPSNIWLQQFAGGVKAAASYQIVSNDAGTIGQAAQQPTASLGSVSGVTNIAVAWTQNVSSGTDIAAKVAVLSDAAGIGNASMFIPQPTPGDSLSPNIGLSAGGDVFVVWEDTSTFGVSNTAGVDQIFFQAASP